MEGQTQPTSNISKTSDFKPKKKNRSNKNPGILVIVIVLILFLLAVGVFYFYKVNYYTTHFRKGSMINGIKVSQMTVSEAESAINEQARTYCITLTGRENMEQVIRSEDIGYHYVPDGSVAGLLSEQNHFLWMFRLEGSDSSMDVPTAYDEALLADQVEASIFFDKTKVTPPADAFISYEEGEGYSITKEVLGNRVKKKKLVEAVREAVDHHEASLDLETAKVYAAPEITSDTKKLVKYCKKLNRYTGLTITYDFDDRTEVIGHDTLKDWLVTDDANYRVSIDAEKVRTYVNQLAYEYDTFGCTRDFTTHDGKEIKVSGGDYGWLINRTKETEELIKAIQKGKDVTREPAYTYTARSRKVNDIGDTYIEVDLTAQHLWVFNEGEMILETDFVSGDVSRKRETPTGSFNILYKERDAQLVGETYNTKVSYWMPFYDNCGIHDAGWRSSFGGDIYLKDGSHGCLNAPPAMAEAIYNAIEAHTPIIVYKGPKASKYKTDPNGKKIKPIGTVQRTGDR